MSKLLLPRLNVNSLFVTKAVASIFSVAEHQQKTNPDRAGIGISTNPTFIDHTESTLQKLITDVKTNRATHKYSNSTLNLAALVGKTLWVVNDAASATVMCIKGEDGKSISIKLSQDLDATLEPRILSYDLSKMPSFVKSLGITDPKEIILLSLTGSVFSDGAMPITLTHEATVTKDNKLKVSALPINENELSRNIDTNKADISSQVAQLVKFNDSTISVASATFNPKEFLAGIDASEALVLLTCRGNGLDAQETSKSLARLVCEKLDLTPYRDDLPLLFPQDSNAQDEEPSNTLAQAEADKAAKTAAAANFLE